MTCGIAASSSCRCASTPSFSRPGSLPSSWRESLSTSWRWIVITSPFELRTSQRSSSSVSVFGAFIQFSGLYAPPSACTATHPSAFTMMSRVASASFVSSLPV